MGADGGGEEGGPDVDDGPPGVCDLGGDTMWSDPMVKKSSRHALAPWGMQPNTSHAALSPRSTGAVSRSCLCAYYTIFRNLAVTAVC